MSAQDWAFSGGFAAMFVGLWLCAPWLALSVCGALVCALCVAARVRG